MSSASCSKGLLTWKKPRDDLEEIAAIKKKSDSLKKSIADHYNCSVTDGKVTIQPINRPPLSTTEKPTNT